MTARQVEKTLADRQQRIDAAQRELILSRADQAAIETAVHELEMAHTETAANVAARDEVLELVRAYPDQDAKDARKALGLISDVGPCSPSR